MADSAVFGGIGALMVAVSSFLYIRDIIFGSTRPHRVTWAVWCLIGVLGTGGTLAGGSGPGAYVPIVYVITAFIVLALCFIGYSKPGGRRYDIPLGVFIAVVLIWWHLASWPAAIAVSVAIAADITVTWMTIRDTWHAPDTEDLLAWAVSSLGAIVGLFSVRQVSFSAFAYPCYLATANTCTTGTIWLGRRARKL
jgi:hypothetical protein